MKRRDFVKATGLTLVGLYLRPDQLIRSALGQNQRALVVVVYNPNMRDKHGTIYPREIQRTLHELLKTLFGVNSAKQALRQLIKPSDVVGLKVNAHRGQKNNATKPAVAYGLAELMDWAGFDKNKIIIWDRARDELADAGYTINMRNRGVRCAATSTHWRDRFRKPLIDFDKQIIKIGSTSTRLSNLITKSTALTINMPVLKTHKFVKNTGVNGAVLNMYRAIEISKSDPKNKQKSSNIKELYDNECDPMAAEVYSIPVIRNKTKLIICDAIYPLYEGGPGDDPRNHWNCNALLASFDPVAIDVIGQEILQKYRDRHGKPNAPKLQTNYLATCGNAKYRLGKHQRFQIQLIEKKLR
ncbi:MAG: DUF362 domain-containing protein [Planctomycetes bacterium]|nr:DUF362 domain-containing protein [Planctomycetota bacterium]